MLFPPASPPIAPELTASQRDASSNFFWEELCRYRSEQFSGCLGIRLHTGRTWSIYLQAGDVIWIDDDFHPHRRWFRHWQRHCSTSVMPTLAAHSTAAMSWSYHCLVLGLLNRSLEMSEVLALINSMAEDVLFDLTQAIALALLDASEPHPVVIHAYAGIRPSNTGKLPKLATIAIEPLWQRTQTAWKKWVEAGLTHCPLYLAPQIVEAPTLQQCFPPAVYPHIAYWLNGDRTLRDLVCELEIHPVNLLHALLPYLHAGVIRLTMVADWGVPLLLEDGLKLG